MSAVWQMSQAKSGDLLVLLAIAHFANDEGLAFPSIPTLAKKARLGSRQVKRALDRLQRLGELTVYKNQGPHGVNLYKVLLSDNLSPVTSVTAGSDICDQKGVTPMSPKPSEEEPSEKRHVYMSIRDRRRDKDWKLPAEFVDEFRVFYYQTYPRRINPARAEKAYVQARRYASAETILTGLKNALASEEWARVPKDGGSIIPHPASWLNARAWESEYTPKQTTRPKAWLEEFRKKGTG